MKYTCEEHRPNGLPPVVHSYKGFQRATTAEPPKNARALALVQNEDCVDMWWLEQVRFVGELRRYYSEQYPHLLHIATREVTLYLTGVPHVADDVV